MCAAFRAPSISRVFLRRRLGNSGGSSAPNHSEFYLIYRRYGKTRKFSWFKTRKLSETLSRNFFHSFGMVSRKNARMAFAKCF